MSMTAWEMTYPAVVDGMDMNMVMRHEWTPAYFALMLTMWWVMMVAMMLPSAAPVVLLAATVNRRAGGKAYGPTAAFVTGYLTAWGGFSVVAVIAQWALEHAGVLSMRMQLVSTELTAAMLFLAGAWQFTSLKQACLRHCRSPIQVLTEYRRDGTAGGLMMGARHGLYCLGCCWFLMGLLFVGGAMNLFWIAGLAAFVFLEKLTAPGVYFGKFVGAVLMVAALVTLYRSP